MRVPLIDVYIILLRNNRNYRALWLSQVVSLLGDWFNLIASASLVAKLSGSGLAIGALFIARLLPPFILGPVAGVVADRFDRRKILITSDVLRAVVVLGFLLVRTEQHIWLLYGLTVVQLSISAFFEPARAAVLPNIVKREDLVTANALSGTTWSVMLAIGAALGGLAAAIFGITIAFILDSITFLVSAWFVSQLYLPATTDSQESEIESGAGWQSFVTGLRYLRQHPSVLVIALLKATAALGFGGMAVVEVTFSKEIFPIGTNGSGTLGLIYFAAGLGTGLGPLVARRISGDNIIAMHWTVLFTFVASFIGYMITGWTPTLLVLLIATFIRTVGGGTIWVYSSSLLQIMVPDKYLGRVFAFDIAMMTLASSISTLWVGWATDTLGLSPYQISLAQGTIPLVAMIGWLIYMNLRFKRQPVPSTPPI